MPDPDVIDAHYTTEKPKRRLIWADRLAIAAIIFINGLLGLTYANWGEPGTLRICEIAGFMIAGVIFLLGRTMDFVLTGRIR